MKVDLLQQIEQLNPWLGQLDAQFMGNAPFYPRTQTKMLLEPEWDPLCTMLIGPRRAGKTTLGFHLCQKLVKQQRFSELLYLNCDYLEIRTWLSNPLFITEALKTFHLRKPILFIDEVQRLPNPGLTLKAVIDLKLPVKFIVTGSSQLEIRAKVKEHLTGRNFTSTVFPLSYAEIGEDFNADEALLYGCYPQIVLGKNKPLLLEHLFNDYISKDVIEILKVGNPDTMRRLISLLAHSSGQLVNYNQLATDCGASTTLIKHYLSIMQQTFICDAIKPFVGNKRKEITSNPIYYFIDNGFRNQALNNFNPLTQRQDIGLLVESAIFQELLKYKTQHFLNFSIHFWRTQSGAEVDFILKINENNLIPIESKYQRLKRPTVSRSFRSFIKAYQPKNGFIITKDLLDEIEIESCKIRFIPFTHLSKLFSHLSVLTRPPLK